jgi:transcriptional regulator with XRE-family HTH domain
MLLRDKARQLLEDRGLTPGDIAQKSGIDAATVRALLAGRGKQNLGTLELLAVALKLSPEKFFKGVTSW